MDKEPGWNAGDNRAGMIDKIFNIAMGLMLLSLTVGVIVFVIATISALGILPGIFVAMSLGGLVVSGWVVLIDWDEF